MKFCWPPLSTLGNVKLPQMTAKQGEGSLEYLGVKGQAVFTTEASGAMRFSAKPLALPVATNSS